MDKPDGVFVSNGPGDPAAVHYAIDMLKGIMGKVPIFGICLGHQLLGLALPELFVPALFYDSLVS
jgi:carbamoyl-phosphate synthase small subunit